MFVKFSGKGIGSIQVLYIEKDVFYDHVLREVLSQFRIVRIADHIPCQPVKPGKGCQAAVFCRAGVLQLLKRRAEKDKKNALKRLKIKHFRASRKRRRPDLNR